MERQPYAGVKPDLFDTRVFLACAMFDVADELYVEASIAKTTEATNHRN